MASPEKQAACFLSRPSNTGDFWQSSGGRRNLCDQEDLPMTLLIAKRKWTSLSRWYALHALQLLLTHSFQPQRYNEILNYLSQTSVSGLVFRSLRSQSSSVRNLLFYWLALPSFPKKELNTKRELQRGEEHRRICSRFQHISQKLAHLLHIVRPEQIVVGVIIASSPSHIVKRAGQSEV